MIPSTNLREFPRRAGIVIPLDRLRDLMREFIDEQKKDYPEQHETELAFEVFLQWAAKKQKEKTS
jgi:4-alpha-glucanotransferase